MMDTKTLYAKVASDNLTDDDKDKLLTLLNNLTKQKEANEKSVKNTWRNYVCKKLSTT